MRMFLKTLFKLDELKKRLIKEGNLVRQSKAEYWTQYSIELHKKKIHNWSTVSTLRFFRIFCTEVRLLSPLTWYHDGTFPEVNFRSWEIFQKFCSNYKIFHDELTIACHTALKMILRKNYSKRITHWSWRNFWRNFSSFFNKTLKYWFPSKIDAVIHLDFVFEMRSRNFERLFP